MKKPRLKIVNDKAFHRMWDAACKIENEKEYIDYFLHPSDSKKAAVNFKKMDFDYVDSIDLLRNIHTLAQLTFCQILTMANLKKAQVSDIFCFPIRTVEEWYTGSNPCSAYVRLMILKQFHLLELGKYIRLESELVRRELPSVYEKHQKPDTIDYIESEYGEYREHTITRTDSEKEFFRKYGFYPGKNVRV